MASFGFRGHDHTACVADRMAAVEAQCAEKKLQLTPIRRRVLELLLEHHKALGAYDILKALEAEGRPAQPPVAYRALDFLTTHGFAHKIERLNAFVACSDPGHGHAPTFLICRDCNTVAEEPGTLSREALAETANLAGFQIEKAVVEAEGVCPLCRDEP
ncbi:Fur family transcriptional regulator [Actibacterium mucosum KCTC 23349]|uniref:Fur family transcriptional regulator n=1 Tax=Actibacterium mucosum KCTC 23349 TaxID=1454373 RepID=A0A037ZIV2_9RHOB|nr:Fur family transcriptional regulator [Actibacterium mucosum]KAJ54760.1 Fur family transcriptional regulator [Actibacterium mucosum KCTC 23349]